MSSIYLLNLHLLLQKIWLGFKLTKVLKNNASSKDTDRKIPKQTIKRQQKSDKDVRDSQRKDR